MSVVNGYVQTEVAAGKLASALESQGSKSLISVITFEVAAADDNASVYRLIKGINPDMVIVDAKIANDALTAGTDWDLGLYETQDDNGGAGAVIDKDCYADGIDLSSAHASGSELSAISIVDQANRAKTVEEIAFATVAAGRKRSYDLCLTANTVGSAAGTVTVIVTLAQK